MTVTTDDMYGKLVTIASALGEMYALAVKAEGLERIAKTATAFVDEQGKTYSRELAEHDHFATRQYEDMVSAVEGAGR